MRHEFSKATKLLAFQRSKGHCEQCGQKLFTGNIEFHHAKEDTFGGTATLDNCVVLCRNCHRDISRSRAPAIAKSNHLRAKHWGLSRRSSRPFPCGKASRFKRKVSGEIVER